MKSLRLATARLRGRVVYSMRHPTAGASHGEPDMPTDEARRVALSKLQDYISKNRLAIWDIHIFNALAERQLEANHARVVLELERDGVLELLEDGGRWRRYSITPAALNPPAVDGEAVMHVVGLVSGEAGRRIITIANDENLTVEEKMARISVIDNAHLGWSGEQWSELLGVSAAACRKTDWWKVERPRLMGRD